jgi:hypothetical protein
MVAIKGHFDGKVIVPDEPVDLPRNQPLIVHVQTVGQPPTTDFSSWLGLANKAPLNPTPRFKSDDDLWEK